MVVIFLVWLAGALVVGAINLLVLMMVWMFTTFIGMVLLGLFVLMVIVNFFTPEDDDEDQS